MVDISNAVNTTELTQQLSGYILEKFSPLITLFKIVGVALLVYILFLIIKALFSWRASSRIKKIAKNVEQINKKLDILIEKFDKWREEKLEKEKVKEKKGIFKRLFSFKREKPEKTEKLEKVEKKAKKRT